MSETNSITRVEDFGDSPAPTGEGMIQVAQSRAAQEVQAAMIVAQRFPRDEGKAFTRIITACRRKSLAERASYMYPKGGTNVSGPSIRLAETLARAWGNMDFGIVELEQRQGESIVMSYAWDLETNTRSTKIFTVKHTRHTKKGDYEITDPREIYEMTANQGARRLRACILAIIPGDIQEAAIQECDLTLQGDGKEPLTDRIRKMLSAFVELGVSQEMLEKRLGHNMAATMEQELVGLRKVYTSIRDGFANRDDFFPTDGGDGKPPKMNLRQQSKSSPPDGATAPANVPSSTPQGPAPETEPQAQAGPSSETTATGTTGEAREKQAGAVDAQAASTPPKVSGRPKAKQERQHVPSKGVEQAEANPARETLLAELRTMADTYPTMYAAEKEHLKIGLTADASDEKLADLREAMLFAIDAFKK